MNIIHDTRKQLFSTLDGLRGVLAVLVFFRHTSPFFYNNNFRESYLAVDIFFLMSGIVISQAYEYKLENGLSLLKFSLIRIIRIYPLYILGSMLTVLSVILGISDNDAIKDNLLLLTFLSVFLLPNILVSLLNYSNPVTSIFPLNYPAWSLFFEIAVNIFYGITIRFLTLTSLISIMIFSGLGLLISIYFTHSHNLDIGWTVRGIPSGFFRVCYSFFTGVLLYRIFQSKQINGRVNNIFSSKPKRNILISWIIIIVFAGLMMSSPPQAIIPYFDFIMVTLIFPVLMYYALLTQPSGWSAHIFKFLGEISYPIYVIHSPLFHFVYDIANATGIPVKYYAPWTGVVFLAAIVPLCWMLGKYYDVPIRKFLLATVRNNKS